MTTNIQKTSRLLSQVLRHAPEAIGITLDAEGWVAVDDLLERLAANGHPLSRADLEHIVRTSDKKRFTLSQDGARLRAAQGHSVPVDLGLEPREPPAILFHGTAASHLAQIRADGLLPQRRLQVHLSADRDTAIRVGRRHGKPVVLILDAAAMVADGFRFYQAENGVWLTDHVPAGYLRQDDDPNPEP
ncbi:RNA 2'-phosphotransferase [Aestuariibius insulae]|uniref:RNA 2'-phosphotransferase n=1 Tax=Aestuariibius insulae TaxID=2058287 RepID=UPI00345F0683